MAWVGFAENDDYQSVGIAARAGCDEGYIEKSRISWDDTTERGRGPTGTSIRTGQIVMRHVQRLPDRPTGLPEDDLGVVRS